jgi:tight adherence protein B
LNTIIKTYYEKKLRAYYFFAVPAFFIIGLIFYHNIIFAAVLSAVAIPSRRFYEEHLAMKFRSDMDVRVKDLLASLSSSFATGRHLTEALTEARGDLSLIYGDEDVILRELDKSLEPLTVGFESERIIMFDFAKRIGSADLRNFTDVYFTCLTTGGDLLTAVHRSSSQIMDKIEIRRGIDAIIAQKKYETIILAVLPVVIMGFLQLSSPEYMKPLYDTPAGIFVMTAALAIMGFSYVWGQRITNVEV